MSLWDSGKKYLNNIIIYKNYRLFRMVKNYFNTNYEKTVLICYIIRPFVKKKTNRKHSNQQEAEIIAKVFSLQGFNVDIVDYNYKKKIEYEKYDLIFGFGNSFENSFYCKKPLRRICYATGADVFFQNTSEIARVKQVASKKNVKILPKRIVPYTWSMSTLLADALIIIGNDFTKNTYSGSRISKYTINATSLSRAGRRKREINSAKNHFLWFGSVGLIHKGLDLCLEVFSQYEDRVLHICGPREDDFFRIYARELNRSNIIYHGFVDVSSDLFEQIASACLFTILPTCSEGQSTSMLTTMAAGLIPIASRQSGIDIEKYGLVIQELNENGVKTAVEQAVRLEEAELAALSDRVVDYVANNHNVDSFFMRFNEIINDIIDNQPS